MHAADMESLIESHPSFPLVVMLKDGSKVPVRWAVTDPADNTITILLSEK